MIKVVVGILTILSIGSAASAQTWVYNESIDPIDDSETYMAMIKEDAVFMGMNLAYVCYKGQGDGIFFGDNGFRFDDYVDVAVRIDKNEAMSFNFNVIDSSDLLLIRNDSNSASLDNALDQMEKAQTRIVFKSDEETFIAPVRNSGPSISKARAKCK